MPIIRNYGHIIFSISITAIFVIFAIRPTVETILVLQKKLQDSDIVLTQITKKAENLSLGKQNYDKLDSTTRSQVQAAIPDTTEIRSVTQTLEQAAERHDASVSALQIQPLVIESKKEDIVGTLSEISFTFNATGFYQDLTSLLQDLKSSDRLISIDSLSLSSLSEDKRIIISVTGKAYYLK